MTGPGNQHGASEVGLDAGWRIVQRGRDLQSAVTEEDFSRAQRLHQLRSRELDLKFKQAWGWFLVGALGVQLLIADAAFIGYLIARSGQIEGYVMSSWLGAAVVQVVGLAWIVVRSLFPPDRGRDDDRT